MAAGEQPPSILREFVPGQGNIRERTIRVGHVILPISTIAAVSLTTKPRSIEWIIFTAILVGAVVAFMMHGVNLDLIVSASVFMVIVGAGVAIALRWPAESVLAIGTSSGRTYYLSGHKEFLIRLGELIRRKIDSGDIGLTAEFSVAENLLAVAGGTNGVNGRHGVASERVAHN